MFKRNVLWRSIEKEYTSNEDSLDVSVIQKD